MNLTFNEEQSLLRDTIRSYIEKEFDEAHIGELCAKKEYPDQLDQGLVQLGVLGVCFPEEFGGADLGSVEVGIVIEELSCYSMDFGLSFGLNILGGLTILNFGTSEQQTDFLSKLTLGEVSFSAGYYEPFLFGHNGDGKIKASFENDRLQIGSGKIYSERRASEKNHILLPVITEESPAILIVPQRLLGEGKNVDMLGRDMLGLAEFEVENLDRLEETILLEGETLLQFVSNWMKYTNVMSCVGNMKTVIEKTIRYSKERVQFGKPIGSFQSIQHMIVDAKVKGDASGLYGYWVASLLPCDKKSVLTKEINMANCYVTKAFIDVVNTGLQVMGGYGYMKESHMERYIRDARMTSYYVADAMLQKDTIAEEIGVGRH